MSDPTRLQVPQDNRIFLHGFPPKPSVQSGGTIAGPKQSAKGSMRPEDPISRDIESLESDSPMDREGKRVKIAIGAALVLVITLSAVLIPSLLTRAEVTSYDHAFPNPSSSSSAVGSSSSLSFATLTSLATRTTPTPTPSSLPG